MLLVLPPSHLLRGRQHGTPFAETKWALRRRAAELQPGSPAPRPQPPRPAPYRSRAGAGPSADSTGQGSMGCEATHPCPAVLGPGTQLVGVRGTVATGLSPRRSLGARPSHSSVQWEFRISAPARGLNIGHTGPERRGRPRISGAARRDGQGAQHKDADALDQEGAGARCGPALAGSMRQPAAQRGPHRRCAAPRGAAPDTAPPGLQGPAPPPLERKPL